MCEPFIDGNKAYCKECIEYAEKNPNNSIKFDENKKTKFRFLDCEQHEKECDLIICCECGSDYDEKYHAKKECN